MAFPLAAIGLGLQGASLLGGLFGKKRKHIDPEYLKQHYGAKAQAEETQQIVNQLLNSPYGQQLLATAAEQGQGFAQQMAQKAAASGLDPSTGGQAGAGDFATAAASQAQTGLERGVRSDMYQTAMPIAANNVAGYRQAYIADKMGGGYQDDKASMWQQIGEGAGGALAAAGPGAFTSPAPDMTSTTPKAVGDAAVAAGYGYTPQVAGQSLVAAAPVLPGSTMGPSQARARSIGQVLRGGRNVQRGRRGYSSPYGEEQS